MADVVTVHERYRALIYDGTNGAQVVAELGMQILSESDGILVFDAYNANLHTRTSGHRHRVPIGYWVVWQEHDHSYVVAVLSPADYALLYALMTPPAMIEALGDMEADLEARVLTLEGQMVIVQGDIAILQTDITNIQADIAALPNVQYATAVTDANGVATVTWGTPFSVAPVVTIGLQTGTNQVHSTRITANSTTATTVHVVRAPTVTVLGIDVLGATVNAAGATVHFIGVAA